MHASETVFISEEKRYPVVAYLALELDYYEYCNEFKQSTPAENRKRGRGRPRKS